MPSPFPGMDPYLEGYLWPDVHLRLATKISQMLTPLIRPNYVARLTISVVEDQSAEAEIGLMYPDVEVVTSKHDDLPPAGRGGTAVALAPVAPAPLTLPALFSVEVRLASVEVRDVARNQLVASIEILSPVNKREPGLTKYRQKRQRLHRAGVHLLEIDLLRRGARPLAHPRLPSTPYLIALTRAQAGATELWPLGLQDRLPTVPVPLRDPDPDAPLELSTALAAIYDEAAYDLSLDYRQPPPSPPLSAAEAEWLQGWLKGPRRL